MMGPKLMMAFMFCFVILTIFSLILEGTWLGSEEDSIVLALTGYTTKSISWYQFPLVGVGFLTTGMPTILSWDYSFLDNLAVVRWIFFCIFTVGFVWALLQIVLPIMANLVSSFVGGIAGIIRR